MCNNFISNAFISFLSCGCDSRPPVCYLVFIHKSSYVKLVNDRFERYGGSVVRALDTRPKGPRFSAQPMHY